MKKSKKCYTSIYDRSCVADHSSQISALPSDIRYLFAFSLFRRNGLILNYEFLLTYFITSSLVSALTALSSLAAYSERYLLNVICYSLVIVITGALFSVHFIFITTLSTLITYYYSVIIYVLI